MLLWNNETQQAVGLRQNLANKKRCLWQRFYRLMVFVMRVDRWVFNLNGDVFDIVSGF